MKVGDFQLGEVLFDPATRALSDKDGDTVALRNKSKDVLVCLLETPGETVEKAHILKTVWSDVTVTDESLVQCIADIRRIIGEDARQIVETVPRKGYRINMQPSETPAPRSGWPIAAALAALAVALGTWTLWPDPPAPVEISTPDSAPTTGHPGTFSTEAYLEVLQGRVSANRFDEGESLIAERHFRRAIELDPAYARAYAELGTVFAVRFENNWTVLEDADRQKALFYAEKALDLDPDLWLGHYALGRLHSVFSDLEQAETHLEQAMTLQPENEDARAYYATLKIFQGDPGTAIEIIEPTIRSHPNPPYWYYLSLGHALFNLERYREAEKALTTCLDLAENSPYCLRYLIAIHGENGELEKAHAVSETYAAIGYNLSIASILDLVRFHHDSDRARLSDALKLAGLPD